MELKTKLEILSSAAKYDVSCSSSGSSRKNKKGGIGNGHASGICHSWSDDGRCISLLKILFTNRCIYDCVYCVNRASNDVPRALFTPREVATLTIEFYKRNYIEGLFLSSAVYKNPNYTMELLVDTVRILRKEYLFNGYIHLKAIPGAADPLIQAAGNLVDRMSVNIELPSSSSLRLLAPQKNKESIIKPMGLISSKITETREEKKIFKKSSTFVPAGQSTQLIVGATPDNDLKILRLSESLYKRFALKRVYYSAYVPVAKHPNLPSLITPPLLREHRLYQADWLLRFYGFSSDELLNDQNPEFDLELDPKANWAVRNLNMFPVEVNTADLGTLLRVPGIGVRSARRILINRKVRSLDFEDLKKIGVVLKRARHFITVKGRFYSETLFDPYNIKQSLILKSDRKIGAPRYEQLSMFPDTSPQFLLSEKISVITGEL
ncbi:MAG: putative DNA modification/repair radical SAM protein [Clostridia bacterium]|nr:putative DNA modification/repair radical SAM protein [Clostridia bacterium]